MVQIGLGTYRTVNKHLLLHLVVRLLVFKGLQKTTLIDFPGKVACTFFLAKCNFRCPFCYNASLVFDRGTGFEMDETKALEFLAGRNGFLDGVCITGGEPLLHPLEGFLKKVKALGLLVKLDTNGSMPAELKSLLGNGLLDYVAMDIKASKEGYEKAAGTKVDLEKIRQSISLLKNSGVDYEFRCTVVPSLHDEKGLLEIGEWLKGSKRLFLQQFNSSVPLLDASLQGTSPFSNGEMRHFAVLLKPFFGEVGLRGI